MILISYDGSADAQAAIDRIAQLSPGAQTVVLTIWESFTDTMVHNGWAGMGYGNIGGIADLDDNAQEHARATAIEGVERATAAGLVAESRIERRNGDIGAVILATAGDLDADVIAMGTRGLSGVRSFLAGSVSHSVVQHADRAVLIVPSAELAEHRHVRHEHASVPA